MALIRWQLPAEALGESDLLLWLEVQLVTCVLSSAIQRRPPTSTPGRPRSRTKPSFLRSRDRRPSLAHKDHRSFLEHLSIPRGYSAQGRGSSLMAAGIVTCADKTNCGPNLAGARHCKLQALGNILMRTTRPIGNLLGLGAMELADGL